MMKGRIYIGSALVYRPRLSGIKWVWAGREDPPDHAFAYKRLFATMRKAKNYKLNKFLMFPLERKSDNPANTNTAENPNQNCATAFRLYIGAWKFHSKAECKALVENTIMKETRRNVLIKISNTGTTSKRPVK